MPGPRLPRSRAGGAADRPGPGRDVDPEPSLDRPTADRLERLADLVAAGEVGFPEGLSPAEEGRLIGLVRARLRGRLVRYIARQIAADIARDAGAERREGTQC